MMSDVIIRTKVRSLISNCEGGCCSWGDYEVFFNQIPITYWETLTEEEQDKYISNLKDEYINECISVDMTVEYDNDE